MDSFDNDSYLFSHFNLALGQSFGWVSNDEFQEA